MSSTAENISGKEIAGRIDYAFLKVDSRSTVNVLRQFVEEFDRFGFRSLCLPPNLAGTVKKNYPHIRVCAVVSYPLGNDSLATKIFAMQELIEQQVDEIDIVMDLFAIVNNNTGKTELETKAIAEQARQGKVFLKTIIETPILNSEQIRTTAEILLSKHVPCVKTSTGYGREPTSLDHVSLLRDVVGREMQIKASGGIKNLFDVRAMMDAGAGIIGTSNAVAIMEEVAATN